MCDPIASLGQITGANFLDLSARFVQDLRHKTDPAMELPRSARPGHSLGEIPCLESLAGRPSIQEQQGFE